MKTKLASLYNFLTDAKSNSLKFKKIKELIVFAAQTSDTINSNFGYNDSAFYTIEPGDNAETINRLAEHSKFFLQKVLELNPDLDLNNLKAGKMIKLPPKQVKRNENLNFSGNAINFVKQFDSMNGTFIGKPITLSSGYILVGYGHKLDKSVPIKNIKPIKSDEEAVEILIRDLNSSADFIKKHISRQLTQNQFDALTVHLFDLGIGREMSSSVVKALMVNDISKAVQVWSADNTVTSYGNKQQRRAAEMSLFRS